MDEPDLESCHPLEAAMIRCRRAVDARGLKIRLVDVSDVDDVRRKLLHLASSLQPGYVHLGADLQTHDKLAESNTAHNVALLAELLAQWLKYEAEHAGHLRPG